jgi:hypothetical protein
LRWSHDQTLHFRHDLSNRFGRHGRRRRRDAPALDRADGSRPDRPDTRYHVATDEFGLDVVNNAQGFRADHTIAEKSPASYRIAAIGGSIVFGWGVDGEKSFLAVIERTLGAMIAPRQIEMVNLGRPGADVADYERVERDLALPLKPDLILLTFFYGRDSVVGLPDAWGMTPDSAYKGRKPKSRASSIRPTQRASGS